jgi:acyl dehydratase
MILPVRTVALSELPALAGQTLGASDWVPVTQEMIDQFAEATGDNQWIHVDPERAARGPFGTTIAHGYLTLSLIPMLVRQVLTIEGVGMGVNYGLNRCRFPAPVPSGCRVRGDVALQSVDQLDGGTVQLVLHVTITAENADKASCVAEILSRYYPHIEGNRTSP